MALTKPTLLQMAAFDATSSATFKFTSVGGDQVTANRLVIKRNSDNVTVYDNTQQGLGSIHTVAANSLVNGTYYVAQIQTFNSAGSASELSSSMQFWCYTTPTLVFTNIPADGIIQNSSFNFRITYNQAEGELGYGYDFFLYDEHDNIVKAVTGNDRQYIYDTVPPPTYLNYTFSGMTNNTIYKVQCVMYTIHNTKVESEKHTFRVEYKGQVMSSAITLTNNFENGNIKIETVIHNIEGTSDRTVVYIDKGDDDKEADLTDGNVVHWTNQFDFFENYVVYITGRKFQDNTKICTLGDQNEMWYRIYLDENNNNAEMVCIEFINIFIPGFVYRIFSNSIPKPLDTDYLVIYHRMGNDMADITIENIGDGVE